MSIRWIWGNFIEPEWKLTRAETRAAHRLAHQRYMTRRRMLGFTLLVLALAYIALGMLHGPFSVWLAALGVPYAWSISMAVVAVAIMIAGTWSYHFLYRGPLRRAMRDLGYDVCITCGYWLRGLGEEVKQCPECGTAREAMPEPKPVEPSS